LKNEQAQKDLAKWDYLLAGGVFLLGLALYVRTLAPGLLLGDSGEFQTLAYTLGIAHNTGYPIYLLIGKLLTLLPFKSAAYWTNFLSTLAAAFTLAEIYLMGVILTGKRWLSILGPLLLAINAIFWWQAVIAEVYTPAAAFTGGVLLCVILWGRTRQPRPLLIGGLLGGLSLGVHTLVALAAPAVLAYLLLKKADRRAWKAALTGALVGVAIFALSFFALDAYNDPTGMPANFRVHASAYGLQPEDFDSPLTRIDFIFFSRQWRGQMFSGTADDVNNNILTYQGRTWSTFGVFFAFVILVGTVGLFTRKLAGYNRWREGVLLLGSWLAMMVFLANYRVGDLEVFFIPLYTILAVFLVEGVAAWIDESIAFLWVFHVKKPVSAVLVQGIVLAICLWALWPDIGPVQESIRQGRIAFLDESRISYPYPVMDPGYPEREARKIADRVEDNAILFINWDMIYPACYVTHVEQKRNGIACYEPMPFGTNGRMATSALKFISENIDIRPIYFSTVPDDMKGSYRFRQVGFSYPLYKLEKR